MMKVTKRNFLKQFWKERQMVGALSPSSRFLGEKMLENVDFTNLKQIVELGPGTGVFTDLIIERMSPDCELLVFELNDEFYKNLTYKIKDHRVKLIHDSAEHIQNYLEGNQQPDAIVSSLPLMMFPESLRQGILKNAYASLKENGTFIQFQYSLQSKKNLERIYGKVKIKFTLKNFPPAFIYTCIKQAQKS